jgi:hypothetical protein
MQEVAIMAAEKEGGRTRRQGSAGRRGSGRDGGTVKEEAGQGGGLARTDLDPWGAFFEDFWGQAAEGEGVDRPDGGREPAEGPRTTGTKPGRRGRSPRAS